MASTSVHFPKGLLEELDRVAAERGLSRNRLIVESCQEMVGLRRTWPAAFFSNDHLSAAELAELQTGAQTFAKELTSRRRNRHGSPL